MIEPPVRDDSDGRRLPELQPGEIFASRYEIEKRLGTGLHGQVYLVRHIKYGRPTVLKVFYPGVFRSAKDRADFESEFEKIKRLKHPGVPPHLVQGDWAEANSKYCTLDYVNGSSLRTLMDELKKQGKRLAPTDGVQIITKLLETLKAIHPSGVTHRNIKPENVLILAKGSARQKVNWDLRLSDFALVRAPIDWMHEVSPEKRPYMSPESLGYGGDVDARADVYSVGALLYEMLIGRPPDMEVVPPTSVRPSLPKKFDDIVDLCLAHSPADRYSSVQDLLFDLRELPAVIPYEEDEEPRKWWTPLLAAAGVIGLCAVIGVILWKADSGEQIGPEQWEVIRQKVRSDTGFVTESPEEVREKAGKEPGMVYIPGGTYIRGHLPEERLAGLGEPATQQTQMPGFYIDQYEFPNKKDTRPATSISWASAERKCNEVGKRLCTMEEWERACKGTDSLIYSYGDTYDPTICPHPERSSVHKTGASPNCKSSFGVYDLSGGIPEWVGVNTTVAMSSWLAPQIESGSRIVKGGNAGGNERRGTRCASIRVEAQTLSDPNLGFRCCK